MSILCALRDYFPKLSDRSLVWRVILHPQRLRSVNKWFLLKRLIIGMCENPDVCVSIYHNVNNITKKEKKKRKLALHLLNTIIWKKFIISKIHQLSMQIDYNESEYWKMFFADSCFFVLKIQII